MSKQSSELGKSGEDAACSFLKTNGYKIILRNYKNKLGEIDIIAQDKGTICFVEVKARHSSRFGSALEAVSIHKQRQIVKVALAFLQEKNLFQRSVRFDVVALEGSCGFKKAELIKNAFEAEGNFDY